MKILSWLREKFLGYVTFLWPAVAKPDQSSSAPAQTKTSDYVDDLQIDISTLSTTGVFETASRLNPQMRRPGRKADTPDSGVFYDFDNLLDDLPKCYSAIGCLKKFDPDAYGIYSRFGARLVCNRQTNDMWELDGGWRNPNFRPAWGASFFNWSKGPGSGICTIQFVYFKKVSSFHGVQINNGTTYEVTVVYEDPDRPGKPIPFCFYVSVLPEGGVRCLKEHRMERRRLKNGESIPQSGWFPNKYLVEMSRDAKGLDPALPPWDAFGREIFIFVANSQWQADTGVLVRARKRDVTLVFNIEMTRTAHFFKSRRKTHTATGKTKPIFHFVRPHRRVLNSGRTSFVKMHPKGERRFFWNDFNITLSMPGLHHVPLTEFSAPSITEEEAMGVPTLSGPDAAARIAERLL